MMKKIPGILLCFVLMLGVLCGCGEAQPGTSGVPYEDKVYDEVIAYVKEVLTLPADATMPDGMEGIFEFGQIYGDEALDLMCYQYRDVNEDLVPELLIGVSMNEPGSYLRNQIYQVYTVVDTEPVCVISGSYRSSYSLLTNDNFGYFASDSAIHSILGEYSLEENGVVDCVSYYFTHETEENPEEIAVYYNTSGFFVPDLSEKTDLKLGGFETISEEMALRTLPLTEDARPLREYQ